MRVAMKRFCAGGVERALLKWRFEISASLELFSHVLHFFLHASSSAVSSCSNLLPSFIFKSSQVWNHHIWPSSSCVLCNQSYFWFKRKKKKEEENWRNLFPLKGFCMSYPEGWAEPKSYRSGNYDSFCWSNSFAQFSSKIHDHSLISPFFKRCDHIIHTYISKWVSAPIC